MVKLEETPLPGVGVRHDFDGRYGKRVGVITHRDGRREIFVSRRDDPDACAQSIVLSDEEAEAVADLLGGSTITRHVSRLTQDVEGLAIDWLPMPGFSPYAGQLLGDTRMRTRTGASIVAIMRGGQAIPAPDAATLSQPDKAVAIKGFQDRANAGLSLSQRAVVEVGRVVEVARDPIGADLDEE